MPLSAPFLKRITLLPEKADKDAFPFEHLTFLKDLEFQLDFTTPITILVGENGSGKSTLMEAIAVMCGFHRGGGSEMHQLHGVDDGMASALPTALRPSWLPKVNKGWFFRSESFFDIARYVDTEGSPIQFYGGKELHAQSHGESFLSLFGHRLGNEGRAIYLMDEPETALSPQRQLAFLRILRDWELSGNVQVIMATHSPILMSYPGARLISFDGGELTETIPEETEHYRVTKAFLGNPQRHLEELFREED